MANEPCLHHHLPGADTRPFFLTSQQIDCTPPPPNDGAEVVVDEDCARGRAAGVGPPGGGGARRRRPQHQVSTVQEVAHEPEGI